MRLEKQLVFSQKGPEVKISKKCSTPKIVFQNECAKTFSFKRAGFQNPKKMFPGESFSGFSRIFSFSGESLSKAVFSEGRRRIPKETNIFYQKLWNPKVIIVFQNNYRKHFFFQNNRASSTIEIIVFPNTLYRPLAKISCENK